MCIRDRMWRRSTANAGARPASWWTLEVVRTPARQASRTTCLRAPRRPPTRCATCRATRFRSRACGRWTASSARTARRRPGSPL
eukprot:6180684-Alexandrium_andersonii.AAC.1